MTWVYVGSAVVSVAGSVYAANKQAGAANNATNLQSGIYGSTVERNAPFVQQGTNAVNSLGDFMGTSGNTGAAGYGQGTHTFNASDLNANMSPNYAFQLQQGEQALDRLGSSQGSNGLSGNYLAGAQQYVQGTAAGAYQQAYNNFNTNQSNIYNRLAGLAGIGQASANQTAQAGSSAGAGMASTTLAAGAYGASGVNSAAQTLSGFGLLSGLNGGSKNFNNLTPTNNAPLPADSSAGPG